MNFLRIRLGAILALSLGSYFGLCLLCTPAQSTNHPFLSYLVTFEQVSNVVKKGVSREAVIKAFGEPPFGGEKISNLEFADIYPMEMPKRLADFKDGFAGFQVRYLSNRVESWSPIVSNPIVLTTNKTPFESIKGVGNIKDIAFHVVYDMNDPSPGWRYIDTTAFPHLGSIRTNADFVTQNIPLVEMTEANLVPSSAGRQFDITIYLADSQTNTFANLMTRYSGKKLVMMVDNEPIAAPYILEPITDGRVSLSFRGRNQAEEVIKRLSKPHPAP